jgi:hypothetical protein
LWALLSPNEQFAGVQHDAEHHTSDDGGEGQLLTPDLH